MSEVRSETRLAKIVLLVDPDITNGRPLNVVINHGSRQGVKVGDQFVVFGIGPHIADPDTGEDLGILERVRGRGEVLHVQEHLATIRSSERRRTRPAKRVIRDPATRAALGLGLAGIFASTNLVEEELSPEEEVPFNSVQLGDFAKPI
jgi:hypothetical protein